MKITINPLSKVTIVALGLLCLISCQSTTSTDSNVEDIYPWCIVAFDSMERSPQERIQLLKELGFKKYAYDWRDHHLDEMGEEITLARENDIEVISSWLWLNAKRDSLGKLSPANQRMLQIIQEQKLETDLWLSFNNNFFEELSQPQALEYGAELVRYVAEETAKVNCRVVLYNHSGWFADPANQVAIIKSLPDLDLGIVYNFHHGQEHIERFEEIVDLILPYLVAVNLNGMKVGGPKILQIGKGDHEGEMIRVLMDKGFNGPWGILGHVEGADVEYILKQNIMGLNDLFD